MGSLPSATTTACCFAMFAGALFSTAQNKPTRAKTVSTTSTTLFIGGASEAGFWCGGSICIDSWICICDGLWKRKYFWRGSRSGRSVRVNGGISPQLHLPDQNVYVDQLSGSCRHSCTGDKRVCRPKETGRDSCLSSLVRLLGSRTAPTIFRAFTMVGSPHAIASYPQYIVLTRGSRRTILRFTVRWR